MAGEKRGSQRRTMFKVFRYAIEGREYADLSTNISERGIFIKSFSPPAVGTEVVINARGPEGQTIRLVGKVAHVNLDPDPHKRGMGIEFTAVVADSAQIIQRFVKEIFGAELATGSDIRKSPVSAGKNMRYEYRIIPAKSEPPDNAPRRK